MKIIRPVTVADPALVSSNIVEADAAAWSASASYAAGARVVRAHMVYESLVAGNLAKDPVVHPEAWVAVGPTNRWRMFDKAVGTASTATGRIDIVLAAGAIDALAVLDTDAETVAVSMTVGGLEIYARSQSTNAGGQAIVDWFTYFFEPVGTVSTLTFMDLPVYADSQVSVTIKGRDPDGSVSVGTLIVGRQMDLGPVETGAQISIIDYSRKVTDDFGTTAVVERAWAKRMAVRVMAKTVLVDGLQRSLAALRAQPILWIAQEGYDSLTVYGFYKDFSIDVAYGANSYASLTIEGLI